MAHYISIPLVSMKKNVLYLESLSGGIITLEPEKDNKRYFHSTGTGFKTKLEAIFRKYRAGNRAKEILAEDDFGSGAVYVPAYCLAVSPHVRGRTRRTRIEPLYYPYDFTNGPDTVYYPEGVTEIEWTLPSIHGTTLAGRYHVIVGTPEENVPDAEFWVVTGDETEWQEGASLQLAAHRNNPDFEKIPGNIRLHTRTRKEVTFLLEKLVQDANFVREETFPELTRPWAEEMVRKLPVPENLKETIDRQDNLQELNIILLSGLEKFSSPERPRTTWTKWAELYGRRGVQRKTDSHTHDSHDVNRVKRFMSHHPNVKDPEELRKLWIIKNETRRLKSVWPTLSDAELVVLVNVEEASCSISLENFRKAIEGGGRKISIEASVSHSSENLTISDRLESAFTVEDEAFTEDQIKFVVESLTKGSGLSSDKIRSGIQKTATGYKLDSKTKETLFSPWLQDDERWDDKIHRQRAISRAHSELTSRGTLNHDELIVKAWDTKTVDLRTQESIADTMRKSLTPHAIEAITRSRYPFLQAVYILAATGVIGSKGVHRPDLIGCAKEICQIFEANGIPLAKIPVMSKSDSYEEAHFNIIGQYNLTREGFETIMESPYDLRTTIRVLSGAGIIDKRKIVAPKDAKIAKLTKIVAPLIEIPKGITSEAFSESVKYARDQMVAEKELINA